MRAALQRPGHDYEDLVVLESARAIGAEGIVTRNPRHLSKADLPVYVPADVVNTLML